MKLTQVIKIMISASDISIQIRRFSSPLVLRLEIEIVRLPRIGTSVSIVVVRSKLVTVARSRVAPRHGHNADEHEHPLNKKHLL